MKYFAILVGLCHALPMFQEIAKQAAPLREIVIHNADSTTSIIHIGEGVHPSAFFTKSSSASNLRAERLALMEQSQSFPGAIKSMDSEKFIPQPPNSPALPHAPPQVPDSPPQPHPESAWSWSSGELSPKAFEPVGQVEAPTARFAGQPNSPVREPAVLPRDPPSQ